MKRLTVPTKKPTERKKVPSTFSSLPNYRWGVVGMLWMAGFLNYADRQVIFSLFPLLEEEMGLTKVELGMLGSAFAWAYGLAAPLAGNLIDRVKRKTAIICSLLAWSLVSIFSGLGKTLSHLLFLRGMLGLSETSYFPGAMSLISDYHGRKTRSRAMGIHQTSVYLGTVAGGFLGGLIGQHYGWRWAFIIFGLAGIILAMALGKMLAEPVRGAADLEEAGGTAEPEGREKISLVGYLRIIQKTPTLVLIMLAFMLSNFVGMVLLSWMPMFLYEKFGLSLAMAGLTATIYIQLSSMLGAPLGGWLADALRRKFAGGRIAVQMLGLLLCAPFVVWCSQTRSSASLIIALLAWGFFKGIYDANIFAAPFDVVSPEARGSTVGFMNMIGWLVGAGTAPVFIGYVAGKSSLDLAIATAAGALLIAAILLLAAIIFTVRPDLDRLHAGLKKN